MKITLALDVQQQGCLTRQHDARRYELKEHQNWRLQDWRTVLSTNESRFHLSACDRRVRVWRRPGLQHCGNTQLWNGVSDDMG